MKALIDTCIIIDALQDRKPFSKDAQQIFYCEHKTAGITVQTPETYLITSGLV